MSQGQRQILELNYRMSHMTSHKAALSLPPVAYRSVISEPSPLTSSIEDFYCCCYHFYYMRGKGGRWVGYLICKQHQCWVVECWGSSGCWLLPSTPVCGNRHCHVARTINQKYSPPKSHKRTASAGCCRVNEREKSSSALQYDSVLY